MRDARCGYRRSLDVLARARAEVSGLITKTSIMLGLGEREDEVEETMRDLRAIGVEVVTFGQYLRPTPWHLPVLEWVTPEKFDEWKRRGLEHGFRYVASGPLVRSSYRAGELFLESAIKGHRNGD